MSKGHRRWFRTSFELRQEDAWWRTAFTLAEIHNGVIAQVQAWGGAKDAKPVKPKDMNPLEQTKKATVINDDGNEVELRRGEQIID